VTPEINSDEIKSLIFIEDWYWDKESLKLKKIVTGIAPVRTYFKSDEEGKAFNVKEIVYVVYFNDTHIPII
jgi:hypothetical protein